MNVIGFLHHWVHPTDRNRGLERVPGEGVGRERESQRKGEGTTGKERRERGREKRQKGRREESRQEGREKGKKENEKGKCPPKLSSKCPTSKIERARQAWWWRWGATFPPSPSWALLAPTLQASPSKASSELPRCTSLRLLFTPNTK